MSNLQRILIEGCDGSGKSSLVRFLEDQLDGNTFTAHWTAPPKEMPLAEKKLYMDKVHKHGVDLARILKNHIIYDRFHTSDLVYLPIYSDGINENTWYTDTKVADLGFKQVYVFTSVREIYERLAERGDWFINMDDIQEIIDRYEHVIRLSKVPTFFYYTGPMMPEKAAEQKQHLLNFLGMETRADETVHKGPTKQEG